jgi:hypothetical protein
MGDGPTVIYQQFGLGFQGDVILRTFILFGKRSGMAPLLHGSKYNHFWGHDCPYH